MMEMHVLEPFDIFIVFGICHVNDLGGGGFNRVERVLRVNLQMLQLIIMDV